MVTRSLPYWPAIFLPLCAGLATPQIRNVGTIGGNLNQRPRCWYYRHPLTICLKKGGDKCFALAGYSKYLCVTGGDGCYIVHPSDIAVALTALDARVDIAGPSGARTIPIDDFFIGPGQDVTRETVLVPGEILTGLRLPPAAPPSAPGTVESLYLKAGDRETGDFALASLAALVEIARDGGEPRVRKAALALGGVAPVPYRPTQVGEYLEGRPVSQVDTVHAGSLALPEARPMRDNAYKVDLARNLISRALEQLLPA